jgi:hypothetical protein
LGIYQAKKAKDYKSQQQESALCGLLRREGNNFNEIINL